MRRRLLAAARAVRDGALLCAELRDAETVERATVSASFTSAARFVALPLPAGAVIRALTALDAGGRVLSRITINP